MVYSAKNNKRLWFGTLDWMQWIDVPLSGANVSPAAWAQDGTTLGGGGYALNSSGSHKRYMFEWRKSSARRMAQLLKDYRDGAYGRGLIYFVDPLTYDTNILPARWANPTMTAQDESSTLVYTVSPSLVPTSNFQFHGVPSQTTVYDLTDIAEGYREDFDTVFLPIPTGYDLKLGAMYSATGDGGIFYSPVVAGGAVGTAVRLTEVAVNAADIVPDIVSGSGIIGVRLWIGKDDNTASTVSVTAMTARLAPAGDTGNTAGPWCGGQGHSGCGWQGVPTYINNTGVDGGQVSFAASFIESGSWIYG